MGGFLSTILQMLAPIAVEHGGKALRDRMRANATSKTLPPVDVDRIQQVAEDVSVLRGALAEIKAEQDELITELARRADRQRAWIIVLLAWSVVMTVGLIVTIIVLQRH